MKPLLVSFLIAALTACAPSAPETVELPERWRSFHFTEVGRLNIEPQSDQHGLHIHYKDWTYAALLESAHNSMEAAGYRHSHTALEGRLLGFEKPGEQLALKIDGGDGNLFLDVFDGKGGDADPSMHRMTFGGVEVKEVVIRSDERVTVKRLDIVPGSGQQADSTPPPEGTVPQNPDTSGSGR